MVDPGTCVWQAAVSRSLVAQASKGVDLCLQHELELKGQLEKLLAEGDAVARGLHALQEERKALSKGLSRAVGGEERCRRNLEYADAEKKRCCTPPSSQPDAGQGSPSS
jgi:hypothetical protein